MEITLNTTLQTQDIDWNFIELREELNCIRARRDVRRDRERIFWRRGGG